MEPDDPGGAAVTGRVTVLNDLNLARSPLYYEQLMYTNATGSVLVVGRARPGATAGILRGHRYTPLPWSAHIAAAAW